MDRKKILFICVHNSARPQMAEALLKQSALISHGIRPKAYLIFKSKANAMIM